MSQKNKLEESSEKGLAAKAKASGISLSTLKTVYKRGVAAWNSGHRPGTTPQQWGMARVNSYITKGKGTYHGADKDLHEVDSRLNKEPYHRGLSRSTAASRVRHWKKADKLSDRDPKAYEPAPGDVTSKTKSSKYTIKYHKMYNEETKPKRKVTLNKAFRLPAGSKKKFGAYVKNDKGHVVVVKFGDPHLEIKRDNPARRKNFRARHGCDKDPRAKDKTTPKYWSCRQWRAGAKVET